MPVTEPSPPSTGLGHNAMVTALAGSFVRLTGLVREIIFAGVFGAGMATDAYNAAFRAAQFFRELLAEGSLANTYVPIFADTAQKDGLKAAFRLANAVLGVLLVVLGAVTLATFAFADGWVWLVASGFATEADKFALSAHLTRLFSPFVAFVSLASLFQGMLNVRGRFFLPAAAPAAFNLAVIAGCFLAHPYEAWTGRPAIEAAAIATIIGGAGQFLVQVPSLLREGFRPWPTFRGHPQLRRLLAFFIPAFIGIMTVQFNLLVESQLASRFGDGPVSYLMYAFRIVHLPNTIVAGSVGTAALAGLAILAAKGRRDQLPETMREAITINSFLTLPSAVGLYVLAEPMVRLMYERGAFTPEDTAATTAVLRMYAIAVWGICFHRVALPSYFAIGKPYFPMKVAVCNMLAKVPIALLLVYTLDLGFIGLPLSHAVLVMIECAALWIGFEHYLGLPRRIYGDHLRIVAASTVMGVVAWYLRPWAQGPMLLGVAGLLAVLYFGVAQILGLDGPRQILKRIRLRRPRGLPPSVDEATQSALMTMASSRLGRLEIVEDRLEIETDSGRFLVLAEGGLLDVRRTGDGQGLGAPLRVAAVMRVGQGPPLLHGLKLGDRSFKADGDRVVEGEAPGPTIGVR